MVNAYLKSDLASYPGPEKGPGIYCLCMCRHPTFCGGSETTVIWSMFHDRTLLKHAGRYIVVENNGGQFREIAFGQALSYAHSKVGKPKIVFKNQL